MVKHPISLRGYGAAINEFTNAPFIVKRQDREFIPGLLDGFRRRFSRVEIGQPPAADYRDGHLHLYQPVHRTFNIVALEAVCQRPGSPRLNPRDVASAGFVVRRVRNVNRPEDDEAWQLRDERPIGWRTPSDWRLDPDLPSRRPRLNAGHPRINGKLARLFSALEPAAEQVSALFAAPPDVCEEAGRTLFYGLIPVTSAGASEESEPEEIDPDIVAASTPAFLRALGQNARPDIGSDEITLEEVNKKAATEPDHPLTKLMQEIRLLQFGWRVFDSPEGATILPLLDQISLRFGSEQRPLGAYLRDLSRRFVLRDDGRTDPIALPDEWPQPGAALANQIRQAAGQSLQARLHESVPKQQRFDEPGALYRIYAFVRVRCLEGCPPELHWSQPSEPFAIVPWWESGGPLHTISLPDLDPESVKKIKPNIAFKVPPRLAAMLNSTKPDDFLKGNASLPSGFTLGWICSFSIPIITLCAFIVLHIFLVLLHIVFQWLFFIKICIPFPKPQPPPP
jgi:hypothetical protein